MPDHPALPPVGVFPLPDLAARLWPFAFDKTDGAHDAAHLIRVWRNVARIIAEDGGDTEILLAATLLHDCVWVDKRSVDRPHASRLAAEKASRLLDEAAWPRPRIAAVCHAIEAHSYSAAIPPRTHEARVLRDADRLDAIGFIGVARCLWIAGQHGSAIYDPVDPTAQDRPLQDASFALDHFQTKLLTLGNDMLTPTGQKLAAERMRNLRGFYDGLLAEVGAPDA